MKLFLKSGVAFAPSGMPFTDQRTGRQFDGYQLSIEVAVKEIIFHRKSNPNKYPEDEKQWFDESLVRQEFLTHIYSKRPDLFKIQKTESQKQIDEARKCFNCGSSDIGESICPTCSGRKVIGKKCNTCGSRIY